METCICFYIQSVRICCLSWSVWGKSVLTQIVGKGRTFSDNCGYSSLMWAVLFSCSVVSDSLDPMDCSRQASLSMGILQARILEWVAVLFSRGSSQTRDQTQVSCIVGGFFTVWATRETQKYKGSSGTWTLDLSRLRQELSLLDQEVSLLSKWWFLKFKWQCWIWNHISELFILCCIKILWHLLICTLNELIALFCNLH